MIRKFLYLSVFALGGCTTSNEYFDCPAKGGVGCKSISEVNRLVNQQQIALGEEGEQFNASEQRTTPSPSNQQNKMRIWCAPYEDEKGNSFGEVIIHAANNSIDGREGV